MVSADDSRQRFDRSTMVTNFTERSGRWEAFAKILQERQCKVLCAHKFLLLKMRTFCVPVSQDECDQTARVLVEQGAVHSLWKAV